MLQQLIRAATTSNPSQWLIDWFRGGSDTDAGVAVNYNSALSYAYVWSAVSMISSDIATLPFNVCSVDSNGDREVDKGHPAQWILNEEPNEQMDALTFREIITSHALTWGNGYAAIHRAATMTPQQLIPMMPDKVSPKRDDNGRLYYEYQLSPGEVIQMQPRDVLHIKGLGWDGTAGHSVISLARNSWGLGMAAQKHGARFFSQGARPSIVLKTEAKLDKETADMLLMKWDERHADDTKPALLTGGVEVQPFSMSNEDSQWLESRAFQRTEVAVWFKIPPHKLGDSSKVAYNSLESENRSYINQTLKGWLNKWESECRRKLLTERARRNYSRVIKHDTQDLLMADIETQVDVLVKLRNAEFINRDEGRRKLGWGSTEGGDDFTNPNVRPADRDANDTDTEGDAMNVLGRRLTANEMKSQRALLADRLERIQSVEIKEALRAASRVSNFLDWIDTKYETLQTTLTESVRPVLDAYSAFTGDEMDAESIAQRHVARSKADLLEVAGYSSKETLEDNLRQTFDTWKNRAAETAAEIMKGE